MIVFLIYWVLTMSLALCQVLASRYLIFLLDLHCEWHWELALTIATHISTNENEVPVSEKVGNLHKITQQASGGTKSVWLQVCALSISLDGLSGEGEGESNQKTRGYINATPSVLILFCNCKRMVLYVGSLCLWRMNNHYHHTHFEMRKLGFCGRKGVRDQAA